MFVDNTGAISAHGQTTDTTSSESVFDALVLVGTRINAGIGNLASYLEQHSELALLNSRGRWGLNQYLNTFRVRNVAHVVAKYSVVATVALDVFDQNKTVFTTGRDAAVGVVGFATGPFGAFGAGVYFTIDATYPGGINDYAVDYISACTESDC